MIGLPQPTSTDDLLRRMVHGVTVYPVDGGKYQASAKNADGSYRVEINADPVIALRRVLSPR